MANGTHPTLDIEGAAWAGGSCWVAGVDEVGVGPLAGPVTAAAVALRPGHCFDWFTEANDSKQVPEPLREQLDEAIRDSVPFGIGWATVDEIDRVGILPARRLAMLRALEALPVRCNSVISDALHLPVPGILPVIRADAQSIAVAGASIVAKVARDALMTALCEQYPGYGLCRNKGYPTIAHRKALLRRGATSIHRRSYAPVAGVCRPW